ncbi:unnamed protein product [Closterium sp. NIES-54]
MVSVSSVSPVPPCHALRSVVSQPTTHSSISDVVCTTLRCLLVAQRAEAREFEARVKKLLRRLPPGGEDFLTSVEHVMRREKHWVRRGG